MEIEVSLKVRSAIKAKLLELGVHVDEELPDYVMVLVANRRSKAQMDSDLSLFLGDNTTKFTTWLSHVLKKLEQVTMGSVAIEPVIVSQQKTVPASSSSKSAESASVKVPEAIAVSGNKKSDEKKASNKKSDDKTASNKKAEAKAASSKKPDAHSSKKSEAPPASSKKGEPVTKSKHQKPEAVSSESHKKSESKSHDEFKDKKKTSSPKKPETRVKFVLKRPLPGQTIEKPNETSVPEKKSVVQSEPDSSSSSAKPPVVEIQAAESSSGVGTDVLNLGIEEDGQDQEFGIPAEDDKGKSSAAAVDEAAELRKIALQSSGKRKISREAVDSVKNILKDEEVKKKREVPAKKSKHESPPPQPTSSRHHRPTKLRSQVTVVPTNLEEYDPTKPTIKSSVVRIDSREKRKGKHEANRSLIFKAMKDAEADKLKTVSRRRERTPSPSPNKRSRSRSPLKSHHEHEGRHTHSRRREREREPRRKSKDAADLEPKKKSIRDRLGKKAPNLETHDYVFEDYEYEVEEEELESNCKFNPDKDYTLVVHVQNTQINHYEQPRSVRYDYEPEGEELDEDHHMRKASQQQPRFAIQLNSSEEESESECTELKSPARSGNGNTSDPELEVTVPGDDEDLPLPPTKEPVTAPPPSRLADLRAKLATLTKPLAIPSPVQAPAHIPISVPSQPKKYTAPSATVKFGMSFGGSGTTAPAFGISSSVGAAPGFGTICKYWPACSFSNNCKYKHPACKYGSRCTKPGCPYKHTTELKPPAPAKKICSWFPACHNMSCSFFHPKVCRFATNCTDRACVNWHPGKSAAGKDSMPQKSQLKWTKQ